MLSHGKKHGVGSADLKGGSIPCLFPLALGGQGVNIKAVGPLGSLGSFTWGLCKMSLRTPSRIDPFPQELPGGARWDACWASAAGSLSPPKCAGSDLWRFGITTALTQNEALYRVGIVWLRGSGSRRQDERLNPEKAHHASAPWALISGRGAEESSATVKSIGVAEANPFWFQVGFLVSRFDDSGALFIGIVVATSAPSGARLSKTAYSWAQFIQADEELEKRTGWPASRGKSEWMNALQQRAA